MASIQEISRIRFKPIRLRLAQKEALEGYLYITPWVIGFLVFTFGPMLVSLYLSLTQYAILKPPIFIGLNNFTSMIGDQFFWKSLENTLYYAVIFVPLNLFGSLGCALLLNRPIYGRSFFRSVLFLPSITPVVATAILWMWLLQPQVGLLNYLLSLIHITGPGWLSSPAWSKPALILISLWGAIGGGSMLIFLAGLQGVPKELLEAAEVDGAGEWTRFWRIVLPLLSPTMFFNTVLGLIGAFQQFTLAFVITSAVGQGQPAGGPIYSTLFYVLNLYQQAFDFWNMGYASALAWIFFLLVMGFTIFQLVLSRKWVYYESNSGDTKW